MSSGKGSDNQIRAPLLFYLFLLLLLKIISLASKENTLKAVQMGTVNEEARRVVSELNCCLLDQPTSTARLLNQDACLASPVLPPPQLSLGPEPVTEEMRAEEHKELHPDQPPPSKKYV